MFFSSLPLTSTAALVWTPRDPGGVNKTWSSVASSADGSKLVVVTSGGNYIYTSTDSGTNWTARESIRVWMSVASSADGTKLIAAVSLGQLYTSSDAGTNWTARESNREWESVACSADGVKLVAVAFNGQIYTSTDAGTNWTAREGNRKWYTVASSADGTKLVAATLNDYIYTSTDSGTNWTARESMRLWYGLASSDDGTKLAAVVYGGQIYCSSDSGTNWTARESNRVWQAVASSANGTRLIAAARDSQLYVSTDMGVNWSPTESNRPLWWAAASSADGRKLIAANSGGVVYIGVDDQAGGQSAVLQSSHGPNGTITPEGSFAQLLGSNATFIATPDGHYFVDRWYLDGSSVKTGGTSYTLLNVQTDHTVQVTFSAIPFSRITSTAGSGGTVSPLGTVTNWPGENRTFVATPALHYTVDRWYLDGTAAQTGGTNYTLNNILTNHTVHVTFTAETPATISASAASGGTISPRGVSTNWTGQSLSFTAIPNTRYVVNGWYVDLTRVQSGGTSFTWVVSSGSSHSVRVTFRRQPVQPFGDYNGDRISDLAVYEWGTGKWYIRPPGAGSPILYGQKFGFSGAIPVPGDYNGDGVWDLAVYGLVSGNWYVRSIGASQSILSGYNWGFDGAVPVSGDYNGDGVWDIAIYQLATGNWYIRSIGAAQPMVAGVNWGYQGAIPVSGDYNGDGIWDLAVYDARSGNWFILLMGVTPTITYVQNWGFNGAISVPGDFNGDGICDLAVYNTTAGNWYIRPLSSTQPILSGQNWGFNGAIPVPGDFNGDGTYDLTVYDRATGNWYSRPPNSTQPIVSGQNWGGPYMGPGGAQGMLVVNPTPPAGTVKQPYSYQFTGTGGQPPYTFMKATGSAFPPLGLILAPNGVLSGTPSAAGTYTFTITMKGLCGSAVNQVVTITINPYNPDPWSGTWVGSYSYSSSAGNCSYSSSGTLTLTIAWSQEQASGSAQFSSVQCRNTSTCEITGYGGVSGSASAWTSGDTINISTSGSVDSGPCSGQSLGYGLTGTRSGTTITGTFSDGRNGTFTLTRTGP